MSSISYRTKWTSLSKRLVDLPFAYISSSTTYRRTDHRNFLRRASIETQPPFRDEWREIAFTTNSAFIVQFADGSTTELNAGKLSFRNLESSYAGG